MTRHIPGCLHSLRLHCLLRLYRPRRTVDADATALWPSHQAQSHPQFPRSHGQETTCGQLGPASDSLLEVVAAAGCPPLIPGPGSLTSKLTLFQAIEGQEDTAWLRHVLWRSRAT